MSNAYTIAFRIARILSGGKYAVGADGLEWLRQWVLARWSRFSTRWEKDCELTDDARALMVVIKAQRPHMEEFIKDIGADHVTTEALAFLESRIAKIEKASGTTIWCAPDPPDPD